MGTGHNFRMLRFEYGLDVLPTVGSGRCPEEMTHIQVMFSFAQWQTPEKRRGHSAGSQPLSSHLNGGCFVLN